MFTVLQCLALKEKLISQCDWKTKVFGGGGGKVNDSDINHSASMGHSGRLPARTATMRVQNTKHSRKKRKKL